MTLDWLNSPLIRNGQIVRPALPPDTISDADMPDLCLRMHLVLETIEYARCEGRLIDRNIYDPIDSLASELQHKRDVRLAEWQTTIEQFGHHYQLDGTAPIEISQHSLDAMSTMASNFGIRLSGDS